MIENTAGNRKCIFLCVLWEVDILCWDCLFIRCVKWWNYW